jgi:hypothetical protein
MLDDKHQSFELTRMTLTEELEKQVTGKKMLTPPAYDLKHKALFRLVDALSRCGPGPSYSALHMLGDHLLLGAGKKPFARYVGYELDALAKHVQDKLLHDIIDGKASAADLRLTQSGFSLLSSTRYGFDEPSVNYNILNAHYEYKFGMPPSLVAAQDVFPGMILFTESLPFVVSTANTTDQPELATICDACGTDLQMPSPFVLRVLIEELKQAAAELDAKEKARAAREEARSKSSATRHRPPIVVDTPQSTPPSTGPADKNKDEDTRQEQTTPSSSEEDEEDDSDSNSDDDWNSISSSDYTGTLSGSAASDTPHRGRARSRPAIFETSDIQVCRYGRENQRENFSFCSVDCYDLAKATYHDSICGSHIEDYLRKSIVTMEGPGMPSVNTQKLVLLLLVRVLGWAYATSTDLLDLPVVQMLMASPRHPSLKDGPPVTWSFYNNVLRPYQILQAMDGRGDAPKSVTKPDYSDGRIINTIISLIQRHIIISDKILWTKTFDEDGYHEQTHAYSHEEDTEGDQNTLFGRLRPLCDLLPLASRSEDANVEIVDLGGCQIICLPIFSSQHCDDDYGQCIKKSTRLLLHNAVPRLATPSERAQYAKVEDYGEGGTMMDVDQDEGLFEDSGPHTEEQVEEYSGYVDEESYGADDEDFDVAEEDEDMMNF